jgi:hypothetical protein
MAGRHVVKLEQALAKLQTARFTEEAGLLTGDAAEVMDGSKFSFIPSVSPIRLVGAGFSQNPSVVNPTIADLTMIYPLRTGNAAGNEGQWGIPLQCSGFLRAAAGSVITFTPNNDETNHKHLTVWGHSGNKTASKSFLRILYNCQFSSKFTLDFSGEEGYGKVEFTGKGIYKGAPALATQATVVKSTASIFPLRGCTINFLGDTDFHLLKLEFDCAQVVSVMYNPTSANGLYGTQISDMEIKWAATVYKDSEATPEATYQAGTLGTISASWGVAPNKITLATGASKAQIASLSDGDAEGVSTFEATGIVVDNDFSVAADTTV